MLTGLLGIGEDECLQMPEELRSILSQPLPFSHLHPSPPTGPELVAAIGDTVTRTLIARNQLPAILVYDCKEKRKETKCPEIPPVYEKTETHNPRSCITGQALRALEAAAEKASQGGRVAVRVVGEEDLLALPLILLIPLNTILVYGQPHRGVVAVPSTPQAKRLALRLLEKFTKTHYPSPGDSNRRP